MKVTLKNEIQMDEEVEVIEQAYEATHKTKGGYHYLYYENEEKERVVLKFDERELQITRFSQPKSVMRFIKEEKALLTLPTPLGIERFVTVTNHYQLIENKLQLQYILKPVQEDQLLASYRLEIAFSE